MKRAGTENRAEYLKRKLAKRKEAGGGKRPRSRAFRRFGRLSRAKEVFPLNFLVLAAATRPTRQRAQSSLSPPTPPTPHPPAASSGLLRVFLPEKNQTSTYLVSESLATLTGRRMPKSVLRSQRSILPASRLSLSFRSVVTSGRGRLSSATSCRP